MVDASVTFLCHAWEASLMTLWLDSLLTDFSKANMLAD